LIDAFPGERASLERYFRDLKTAMRWITRHFMGMVAPAPLDRIVQTVNRLTSDLPLAILQQYLEKQFRDPQLRTVVASQWADYGMPPGQSAFATHAVIATHYLNGASCPKGGAGEIAKATGAIIRAAGGELLPNHEVTGIVVELFLGLRDDPRRMGFQGENYWIFSSFDHDNTYARRDELVDGRAVMAYLSFPSLKDRQATRHTAEIIAPLTYRALESYRHKPWRRRGEDYEAAKDRITRALLDLIERYYPGFRDLVEYSELGTPLTFEHFTAAPSGSIYGFPGTPENYRKRWLGPGTPIRNLCLTGSDVAVLGIMGRSWEACSPQAG
jgi:phytoene dehydrogenase-like protein